MKQAIQANNAVVYLNGKPIMQLEGVEVTSTLHNRETVLAHEQIESFFPTMPTRSESNK